MHKMWFVMLLEVYNPTRARAYKAPNRSQVYYYGSCTNN